MVVYDRVVTEWNERVRGTSFPIVCSLIEASLLMYVCPIVHPTFTYFFTQLRVIEMTQNFHILAKITEEPPALRTRKYSHPQRLTLRTVSTVNLLEFT